MKKKFGFVKFPSQRDAEEVMRKQNGRKLKGSEMNMERAKASVGDNRRNPPPKEVGAAQQLDSVIVHQYAEEEALQ